MDPIHELESIATRFTDDDVSLYDAASTLQDMNHIVLTDSNGVLSNYEVIVPSNSSNSIINKIKNIKTENRVEQKDNATSKTTSADSNNNTNEREEADISENEDEKTPTFPPSDLIVNTPPLSFGNTINEENCVDNSVTSVPHDTPSRNSEAEQTKKEIELAKNIAIDILNCNFDKIPYTQYSNYIGNKKHKDVCYQFLNLLSPLPVSLLDTLIKLSLSIYFIAEATCIDSILEVTSHVWVANHLQDDISSKKYKNNFKLIHIILFSLLILNSDLHNENSNSCKFKISEFVENTVHALSKEDPSITTKDFEEELTEYYYIIQRRKLPLYKPMSNTSNIRNNFKIKRNVTSTRKKKNRMLTNSALIKSFANNNNNTDFSSKKSFSPATVGSPLSRTTTINDSLCSNNTSVTDLNSTNSTGNNMDNQKLDTFSRLSTEFSSITIDSNNSSSLSRPFTSTTGPTSTRDMGTANSKLYSAEFFDDKYKWQNDTSWFMDNWVEFLEHDLNLNSDFRTSRAGGASTDNNIDNNDIGSDFSQPPKPKTHHSLHKASSTSSLSRNFGKSLKLSLSNTSLNSNVSNTGNTNGNKGTRVDRTHRNTNKTTKLKNFFSRIKVKTEDISDSKFLQDNKDLMIQDLRHQNWKLVNLIVSEGRVYIFIFDRMLKNETGLNSLSFAKKFCSTYEVYNLFGTESKLVEDNMVISNDSLDIDDDKKKWVFTITFPSYDSNSTAKTTFHLRTKNKVLAEKYIQSCNFWSSRITPIPNAQFDMVSNLEYGWSEDILTFGHTNTMGGDNNISLGDADNKSTIVSLWKPLYSIDCLVHTDLQTTQLCDTTLKSQYKNLKIFTQSLSDLIDEHLNIVKPKMLAYWQHYVHISNDILSFDLAMDNWTEKYLFLIKHYDHQILYLNALENLRKEAEKLGDAELQNYFAINGEETQSN